MNYKNIELPEDMREETKRFISNIIDQLDENMQLSTRDTGCYFILAESYDTYLQALEIQRREGLIFTSPTGVKSVHPAVTLAKNLKTTILRTMLEMGLSLRSRKSLAVLQNEAEESPLTEFLKQTRR